MTKHKQTAQGRVGKKPVTTSVQPNQNKSGGAHIIKRMVLRLTAKGKPVIGRPALNEGRVKLTCYVLPTTMATLKARPGTLGHSVDSAVRGF